MPLKSPSKNVGMIFFLNQVSIANKVKFQFLSMTFKDLHDLGPKITSHIIPCGSSISLTTIYGYTSGLYFRKAVPSG